MLWLVTRRTGIGTNHPPPLSLPTNNNSGTTAHGLLTIFNVKVIRSGHDKISDITNESDGIDVALHFHTPPKAGMMPRMGDEFNAV